MIVMEVDIGARQNLHGDSLDMAHTGRLGYKQNEMKSVQIAKPHNKFLSNRSCSFGLNLVTDKQTDRQTRMKT